MESVYGFIIMNQFLCEMEQHCTENDKPQRIDDDIFTAYSAYFMLSLLRRKSAKNDNREIKEETDSLAVSDLPTKSRRYVALNCLLCSWS